MKLIPKVLRRSGVPDEQVSLLRRRLAEFLKSAELTESGLIIDGPGPGVATHFVALSLLGLERINQFRRIHSVSSSAYGLLNFLARHRGMLALTPQKVDNFTRANNARHGSGGWARASWLLLRQFLGSPYLFSNDRAEEALAYGVHADFMQMKVAEFPENLSLWTFCVDAGELCEIRRDSEFAAWSVGQVIRAVTAVKGVYAPFHKAGKTYVDAVTTPQLLRTLYRDLRQRYRHVLFLHMNHDGVRGNTTYVKMHHTGSGAVRIMVDFLYLLSGVENRDLDEAIRVGLDIAPI